MIVVSYKHGILKTLFGQIYSIFTVTVITAAPRTMKVLKQEVSLFTKVRGFIEETFFLPIEL